MAIAPTATNEALLTARAKQKIDECAKDAHLQTESLSRLNRPGGMSQLDINDARSAFYHDDPFGVELGHIISSSSPSREDVCIRAVEAPRLDFFSESLQEAHHEVSDISYPGSGF
ncbi:uncharacterized protein TrAFT101_009839 [Trichoderma asperellum]|uniref:uncharacterized protein n=1 Tax=Trichoderma asperellum TaxID=101201 RepID=UPI003327A547|nr:hypothetical protein TrAFT101_009839 [Trichoderma asperellum]